MIGTANESQEIGSNNLKRGQQLFTSLNSKRGVLQRLRRGRRVRSKFVESHLSKALAFQIRSLREKESWSQQGLAEKISSNQNAVYRAENPNYGKQTITTLKKIAAAFDVALVVRFVPFSELIDWVTGTPHMNEGLNTEALSVPDFDSEDKAGKFEEPEPQPKHAAVSIAPGQSGLCFLAGAGTPEERVRFWDAAIRSTSRNVFFEAEPYVREYWTLQKLAGGSPKNLSEQPLTKYGGIRLVPKPEQQATEAFNPPSEVSAQAGNLPHAA